MRLLLREELLDHLQQEGMGREMRGERGGGAGASGVGRRASGVEWRRARLVDVGDAGGLFDLVEGLLVRADLAAFVGDELVDLRRLLLQRVLGDVEPARLLQQ